MEMPELVPIATPQEIAEVVEEWTGKRKYYSGDDMKYAIDRLNDRVRIYERQHQLSLELARYAESIDGDTDYWLRVAENDKTRIENNKLFAAAIGEKYELWKQSKI